MPYSDWFAFIKEFLKNQVLSKTLSYGIGVKYFFASTFLISSWNFFLEFLREKVLTTHEIFLC